MNLSLFKECSYIFNKKYHEVILYESDLVHDEGKLKSVATVVFDIGEKVEQGEEMVVGLLEVCV